MKMPKLRYRGTIAVDIDGVLADFEGKFCEDFGTDNRHLYSFFDRYPNVDRELIKEYVENPENYRDLVPIFGGAMFCRQAHQRGWYILLVTSRDKSLREVTRNWLDKYGVVYNEIIFAKNKREAIADYDAINASRPVSIVVDDSVEVLKSMPERYCVAWYQLWNFGFYPSMVYSEDDMKIIIKPSVYDSAVGIWDTVGKYEKTS